MNSKRWPPQFFLRFFRWFCHPKLLDHIEGDLIETYHSQLNEKGKRAADFKFILDVLLLFRPGIIKSAEGYHHLNFFGMYKSYFKISIRNMRQQKLYSIINIGGLALGLACFLIIALYVQHEFSFNRSYKNADHIYRVYQKQTGNDYLGSEYYAVVPARLASVMKEEIPEVVNATTVQGASGLIDFKGTRFWEEGLAVDDQFSKIFSLNFLKGDPSTALRDPKSFIVTKSLAEQIFGDQDPLGQAIQFRETQHFTVTAVVEDPPVNSSLRYTFIHSLLSDEDYVKEINRTGWTGNSYYTFFVLSEKASPAQVEAKFPAIIKKNEQPNDYANYPFSDQYFVERITDTYFNQSLNFDIGLKGNPKTVSLFSAVAIIVLLLACVNYMNLAVARSIKRAREVGIRKVVGALRKQVIGQFLSESVLISIFSLLLAIALTYFLLPVFGSIVERPVKFDVLATPWLLPAMITTVVFVGLLSGSFPAFVMSAVLPIHALKAKGNIKVSGVVVQRSLIVIQFVTSIALIIGSIVIYQQLRFIREKDLGYAKKDIITIDIMNPREFNKFDMLQEWTQNPHIIDATSSSDLPTFIDSNTLMSSDSDSTKKDIIIYRIQINDHFLDVFDIPLLAGRSLSRYSKTDEQEGCLINEAAAKAFGWEVDEAIGKRFHNRGEYYTITGVVKDFHMHSMHTRIQPLMMRMSIRWHHYISVKIKPEEKQEAIAMLERSFRKVSPYPFQYQFLEDRYNQLYQSETKLGEIFGFFTVASILIASLGLFGLAAFVTEQRTKEIGIRKVLGATARNIVLLVSGDFLSLVLMAIVIATPIGWYAMNQWLQDFAYRIEIKWWTFALAGAFAILLAKFAVGFQSIKAAMANPVSSLRSE